MAGIQYWRSNTALDSCKPLFRKYEVLTVELALYPGMYEISEKISFSTVIYLMKTYARQGTAQAMFALMISYAKMQPNVIKSKS
jgi:hypothetical protein